MNQKQRILQFLKEATARGEFYNAVETSERLGFKKLHGSPYLQLEDEGKIEIIEEINKWRWVKDQ